MEKRRKGDENEIKTESGTIKVDVTHWAEDRCGYLGLVPLISVAPCF